MYIKYQLEHLYYQVPLSIIFFFLKKSMASVHLDGDIILVQPLIKLI